MHVCKYDTIDICVCYPILSYLLYSLQGLLYLFNLGKLSLYVDLSEFFLLPFLRKSMSDLMTTSFCSWFVESESSEGSLDLLLSMELQSTWLP